MPSTSSVSSGDAMSLAAALSGMADGKVKEVGAPPLAPRFRGRIGCFDQTLSKTGSGLLVVGNSIVPMATGMHLGDDGGEKGHEGSLRRAADLFDQFSRLLAYLKVDLVAHEMPPIATKVRGAGESSLCAAVALRCAAKSLGIPVHMVGSQRAKKRVTGNAKAEKKDVKLAIESLLPEIINLKPWNQDVSDAIAVGIVASEEVGG